MTFTPTCDPLAHLESELELREQISVMPREPELWWRGWETAGPQPIWSVAFAMDLLGCIDAASGFPWVAISDARSRRWMQACGSPAGLMVELGGVEADSNVMGIVGRPGGGRGYVNLSSKTDHVELREHQILLIPDAQAAFRAWVLSGAYPDPDAYEIEFVTY
ncbi:hypothetical protein E3O11_16360 [Cryobacterium levicorallinum]|uniref:Uncharacterized protein n=1 Tax=Cryobacterium levicorallinum TaxID=995038 RepID=A0A1I3D9C2_9MICO|nr:hypothetical protein [Cryobacterium levicorallinum]TFB81848.1 hypothetical protein E3O11_16360 [Cryobacterium levicorallinum]GEP28253.1 hypothetical protein CLE01_28510 [Cryobacterium levicorallinum]SFH83342.1 hypothetical protein SAMN05216274_1177 [Cryobacterium levicorallinum]